MAGWADNNKRYGYYEDDAEEYSAPPAPREPGPEREDPSVLRLGPGPEPELMPERSEAQLEAQEEAARQALQEKIDSLVASGRAERIDIVAIRAARTEKKEAV